MPFALPFAPAVAHGRQIADGAVRRELPQRVSAPGRSVSLMMRKSVSHSLQ